MQEQQRLEYLQAMGIQVWMPRKVIDNAADSLWLAEDAAVSSDSAEAASSPSSPQFNNLSSLGAGLLSDDATSSPQVSAQASVQTSKETQASVQPAVQAENSQASSSIVGQVAEKSATPEPKESEPKVIPKFMLEFSLWSSGILWVSSAKQSDQLLALQNKIGFAFDGEMQQLNQLTFKWPFLEHGREDQSEVVAVRALMAQWQFIQQQKIACCIGMDEEAVRWLEKIDANVSIQISSDEVFTPSGKQQLWQQLSSVRAVSNQ